MTKFLAAKNISRPPVVTGSVADTVARIAVGRELPTDPPAAWTAFKDITSTHDPRVLEETLRLASTDAGIAKTIKVFANSRYHVFVRTGVVCPLAMEGWPPMDWLSIKRHDREPIRDWRDLQRIKNELCGRNREAVELYPAECRMVDLANQYHLWVMPADIFFPFGFATSRSVATPEEAEAAGAKQRKF